jgi:hypothetical protein
MMHLSKKATGVEATPCGLLSPDALILTRSFHVTVAEMSHFYHMMVMVFVDGVRLPSTACDGCLGGQREARQVSDSS